MPHFLTLLVRLIDSGETVMKRLSCLSTIFMAAAVAMPSLAMAQGTPHSFRDEVFVLGMGGAYTAGGWRGSALFYNPATIALKRFHLNIPIRLEFGGVGGFSQLKDVVDYFRNNQDALKNIDTQPPDKVRELDREAQKLDGKGATIRFFPALRLGWRGFAIQTYATFNGTPQMNTGVFQPRLDLNAYSDIGIIAGYGRRMRIFTDPWYAGVSVKYFNRWTVLKSFSLEDAVNTPGLGDVIDLKNRQTGVGVDLGVLYPVNRKLTVGATAQDLLKFGDVKPPMSLNLGAHYALLRRLNLVADYRDLFNSSGLGVPMHLYFGGELDLTLLRLRGGFYQGYPTAGLGVNLWLIKLDAVYYGREHGPKLGYEPEDNVAVELQIGLD